MTLTDQAFQAAPDLTTTIDPLQIYGSELAPSYDIDNQKCLYELQQLLTYIHRSYKALFPFYESQYNIDVDIEVLPLETIEDLELTVSTWKEQNSDAAGCLLFNVEETFFWQLIGINIGENLNTAIRADERFSDLHVLLRAHSYNTVNRNKAIQSLIKKQIYSALQLTPLNTFYENFTQQRYTDDSTYYRNIKLSLELIVYRLSQNDLTNRESILKRTIEALTVCGPGIQTELMLIKEELYNEETLTHWLAQIRKEIVLELAAEHCEYETINAGMHTHVQTAFAEEANYPNTEKQSWNVSINTDDTAKSSPLLKITPITLCHFRTACVERYTPTHIFDWVIQHVSMLIRSQARLYDLKINEERSAFTETISPVLTEAGLTANDIFDENNPTTINLDAIAGPILLRLCGARRHPDNSITQNNSSAIFNISPDHFEQLTQIIGEDLSWERMLERFNVLFTDELGIVDSFSALATRLVSDVLYCDANNKKIKALMLDNAPPTLISQVLYWYIIRLPEHTHEIAFSLFKNIHIHIQKKRARTAEMLYQLLNTSIHNDILPTLWKEILKHHHRHCENNLLTLNFKISPLEKTVDNLAAQCLSQSHEINYFSYSYHSLQTIVSRLFDLVKTDILLGSQIVNSLCKHRKLLRSILKNNWTLLSFRLIKTMETLNEDFYHLPEMYLTILETMFEAPITNVHSALSLLDHDACLQPTAKILFQKTLTKTAIENFISLFKELCSTNASITKNQTASDLLAYSPQLHQIAPKTSVYYDQIASNISLLILRSSDLRELCAIYLSCIYRKYSSKWTMQFTERLIENMLHLKRQPDDNVFRENAKYLVALSDHNTVAHQHCKELALKSIDTECFTNTIHEALEQDNIEKITELLSKITWIMTTDMIEHLSTCRKNHTIIINHLITKEKLDTQLLQAELTTTDTYSKAQITFNDSPDFNKYYFERLIEISESGHYSSLELTHFPSESLDDLKSLLEENNDIRELKITTTDGISDEFKEFFDRYSEHNETPSGPVFRRH